MARFDSEFRVVERAMAPIAGGWSWL